MLAQVRPGELTARLPAGPPEDPELFANVLADLDEVILPAVTHWNYPRFFAYATGEVFISPTELQGRYVLRLAVGNLRTSEEDVRRAWDVLRREAAAKGS